jgi:polar amino acid transport system substrate-binding protein
MVRDAASGEIRGVSVDLGTELARRLGVPAERVEFRRIAEVLERVKSGDVDFTVTNATAARAKDMDFTQPLLAIELGYLVPPGSSISALADLDRPGVRVGVTQGSTSQKVLPGLLKSAAVVPAPTLKAALEMLSQHKLDAFATNKAILFEMSDALPGARVLDGRWGLEHLAIAIPKGREPGMAYARKFASDAMSEGMVVRAAQRAGLRGSIKAESQ